MEAEDLGIKLFETLRCLCVSWEVLTSASLRCSHLRLNSLVNATTIYLIAGARCRHSQLKSSTPLMAHLPLKDTLGSEKWILSIDKLA